MGSDGATGGSEVDLSPEERADIDGMFLRIATSDHYELLGVGRDADRKTLRDAYFLLSKRFHPDVFYGRAIGPYKQRIEEIFRTVTKAHDILSHKQRRAEYDASLGISAANSAAASSARTPANQSSELRRVGAGNAAPASAPTPPAAPSTTPSGLTPIGKPEPTATVPSGNPGSSSNLTNVPTGNPGSSSNLTSVSTAKSVPAMPAVNKHGLVIPPPPSRTEPVVPPVPTVPVPSTTPTDPEAIRAAKEALARRLSGARPMTPAKPAEAVKTPIPNPELNLENLRTQRLSAERQARLNQQERLAREAEAKGDWVGVTNALAVALSYSPDDEGLKARYATATKKYLEVTADTNVEEAKRFERDGFHAESAKRWLRAAEGKPEDTNILLGAAAALARMGLELPRASELARRAVQLNPKSAVAQARLAEVFIAGGLVSSARVALEAAAKLDPNNQLVKDLRAKVK